MKCVVVGESGEMMRMLESGKLGRTSGEKREKQ
jgi:hypothetical protein